MDLLESPALADEQRWYVEHTALIVSTLKWVLLGALSGICVGLGTRLFLDGLGWASHAVSHTLTGAFPYYYFLPAVLPLCVWLIRTFAPSAKGHGTEAVIAAVHDNYGRIPWRVAPIKLVATILTLAFGGSVGKEGPCAQIGASITSLFADILKLADEDRRRLVICGIGAGFAAVFGTPVSGALFGIEVLYLGRIEYPVLLPCLVAGITAHLVCGTPAPAPMVESMGHLSQPQIAALAVVFGCLCGFVALVLIESMRALDKLVHRFRQRPYLVAFIGGLALAVLFRTCGVTFAGLGLPTIDACLKGAMPLLAAAFLIKILATTVTLETGGSGGIITPLFFIGSTFGAAFAHAFHLPTGLFAAMGYIAVVAAAANTPIALSVMGMAILPESSGVYAALAACTAYLLVGHRSVYSSQKLGMVKSGGLSIELDVPVGGVSSRKIKVQPGTVTDRLLRLGDRNTLRRKRKARSR